MLKTTSIVLPSIGRNASRSVRRLVVSPTNVNMRSSPPNIYAQSHGVRAFSWQPWTSKPAPADTLTTPPPPEDAFLKDEPISTPTSPDSSISVSDSVPSSSGPAPDTSLVSSLTDASATLPDLAASTMVPALQHGDMAALGLTGISPPGLICSLLENVHLATGMTWVSTLAVTTVGLRMLLIWPQIRSSRAAARMQPYQARLEAIGVESMEAMKSGDRDRAMALTLERKKIHHDAGIKMSDMFIGPLSMLPVQLGLFFAVKRLCDTPLPQLAAESWQWIPSLASPDPTWLLPILSAASIQASLAIGVKDAANEKAGHTMNAIRVISVVGLPFMVTLDAALNVIILVQSVFGVAQIAVLRQAWVRRMFDIPAIDHSFKRPTMRESLQVLKTNLAQARAQAEEQAKRR